MGGVNICVTLGSVHGKSQGMNFVKNLIPILGLALVVAGCSPATVPNTDSGKSEKAADQKTGVKPEVAVITTTEGEMVAEFWPEVAPKTVENFKTLAKKGFYDGTAFHRIIKGFMIQGGDPLTKDPNKAQAYGTGGPDYMIKAEFNDRKHERGVLSMARSNDPDSAGSQFFICLGPTPQLDHQYTTFGHLIKGDDVLEKLGNTPVGPNSQGEVSRPLSRMGVVSIKIVPADSIK